LNNGEESMYCASADWMPRNFFRRVEVAFPILDPELRQRIREEAFDLYLQDNILSWQLSADGSYQRNRCAEGEQPLSAQDTLMQRLGEDGTSMRQLSASPTLH
ncbi:MAG: RNA degradosome polyphosphate kinase, partial [Thiothrix sp.]|nr:RNA degradosome polyphosphate kinase [Thiothrix sp.]